MYPLKFEKVFKEKVWGGRKFESLLNMSLPSDKNYGESWEVSSHKNGMSIVSNGVFKGKSLEELIGGYEGLILGEEVFNKFKGKFPLLIKYLDVNDKLSVQVHPSDEYALRVEGEFGKSESWYILDASSDAELIMGIKDGVTKEVFKEKSANKEFGDLFNTVKVKKGDFINVNPGLVHATLKGSVVICETQQNSDTTYRIYDFDRLVDGELRPLHLEKAADVIDFDQRPVISTSENRKKIKVEGGLKEELIRGEYFSIDKLEVDGEYSDSFDENFKVLSILEGSGDIIHSGVKYPITKGDTYFIPSRLEVKIKGKVEVLKSFL